MSRLAIFYGALFLSFGGFEILPDGRADDRTASWKIVLVGDSTVTDKAGWGVGFARSLGENAVCVNLSAGGRSSRSFRDEGRWNTVLNEHPDVILIQFGHNDQPGKGPERETDPQTSFRANLSRYVDEAREVGATPVLVTSLSRRLWAPDGVHIASILTDYVEATRSVAKEKSVPLVDLHARSIEVYESLGPAGCEEISPRRTDNGGLDRTHLNEAGSLLFGPIVAQELQKVLPSAGEFLRNDKTVE